MFVFPVFVCIMENAPKNILRCLARRKMNLKKKKKKKNRITHHSHDQSTTPNHYQKTQILQDVNSLLALDIHENIT
jgi:hypothetical protein